MAANFRVLHRLQDWKDRVHVQRVTNTTDDAGGNLIVTQTLFRDVPCVVANSPLSETKSFDRQGAEASHTVVFRTDPQVRNNDRLIFGDHLLVVTAWVNENNLDVVWKLTCSELIA